MHNSSIMLGHLLVVSLLIVSNFVCIECIIVLLLQLILTVLNLLNKFCHILILTEQ